MKPISEINTVHVSSLSHSYEKVANCIRNQFSNYLGSVYELDDERQQLTFQSECLLPNLPDNRIRILCLISNAHPESIRRGMFHFAESGTARLWSDLKAVGLMTVDHTVLQDPSRLRNCCLKVEYPGPFALGFSCYWSFPTPKPDHLVKLFGPLREPPGFENTKQRLNLLLERWQPYAIISFNGEVFENLTGIQTKEYLKTIQTDLLMGQYAPPDSVSYRVFQTYPAAWRFDKNADQLRQDSLQRIRQRILHKPANAIDTLGQNSWY